MERAFSSAGVLAAPNRSLAGGPVGLATFFLVATAVAFGAPSWARSMAGTPIANASAQQRLMRRIRPSPCTEPSRLEKHGVVARYLSKTLFFQSTALFFGSNFAAVA